MGFRTPPSSLASAVDTGTAPADPGVRVLTDTTYPGTPQGIVEWRTGLMTTNARATLSGGSGGSAFTLSGGATAGGTAPTLGLNVESDPVSGYRGVARIDGADAFYLNGRQVATVGAGWVIDLANSTYNAAVPGGAYGTLPSLSPTYTVPAGYVLDVEFRAAALFIGPGAEVALRLVFGNSVVDGADFVNPSTTGTLRVPVRLGESAGGGGTVAAAVQAWAVVGNGSVAASAGFPVTLKHRIH